MASGIKVGTRSFELNPRGNLWFNDDSTFGHKLLAKMGWSKGKGLGKNEDGIKENIKISKRDTKNGIGFENQYVPAGCLEYEKVLQNLQKRFNNKGIGNGVSNSHPKNELESLEQRSKKAKNHLHYQKFVREKDLMRFSDKELNCIFLEKQIKPEEKEPSTEGPTFNSQLSVQDYFASKMQKKLGEKEHNIEFESSHSFRPSFSNEAYTNKRKFVSESCGSFESKRLKKSDSDNDSSSFILEKKYTGDINTNIISKKNKYNKYPNFVSSSDNAKEFEMKQNSKSLDKRKQLENINSDDNYSPSCSDEEKITKKLSKNKKLKENSVTENSSFNEDQSQSEIIPKSASKKKKLRKIDSYEDKSCNGEQLNGEENIEILLNKNSKEYLDSEEPTLIEESITHLSKRKKKKNKNSNCSVLNLSDEDPPTEENTITLSKLKIMEEKLDTSCSNYNNEQSVLIKNSKRKKLKNKNSIDGTHNFSFGELFPVEKNVTTHSKNEKVNENPVVESNPYDADQSALEEDSKFLSKRKKCKKLYSDKESYLDQTETGESALLPATNIQLEDNFNGFHKSEEKDIQKNIKSLSKRKKINKKNSNSFNSDVEIQFSAENIKKFKENSEDVLSNLNDELLEDTNSKRTKLKRKKSDKNSSALSNKEQSDSVSSDDSIKRKKKSKKNKSRLQQLKSCLKNENCQDSDSSRNVSFNEQVSCKILDTSLELCEDLKDTTTNDESLCTDTSYDDSMIVENTDEFSHNYPKVNFNSDDDVCDEECSAETELKNDLSFSDDSNEHGDKDSETNEQSPNCLDLPKCTATNFNFWLESQRQASKMKLYREMLSKMKKHKIIRSTNLLDIKGYGNWGI